MEPPTVREIDARLKADGWVLVRMRGDHRRYEKDGRACTLAGHWHDHLPRGTWAAFQRQVGWRL